LRELAIRAQASSLTTLGCDRRLLRAGDASLRASPAKKRKADRIAAEVNYGASMVEHVLRTCDSSVPFKKASRGKVQRAEPVSALYEQGNVKHVRTFPDLVRHDRRGLSRRQEPGPGRRDGVGAIGPRARRNRSLCGIRRLRDRRPARDEHEVHEGAITEGITCGRFRYQSLTNGENENARSFPRLG
jgi:hypothetical protein